MRSRILSSSLLLTAATLGAVVFLAAPRSASAQTAPPPSATLSPDEIIQKFAAKEAEFRKARENYTYTQILKMEELDMSGNPTGGKWEETTDIIFGPDKERMEHVTYAPPVSLEHISLDPEDVQDLRSIQPFVLTTEDIGKYDITYVGKEKLDELNCYEFSVKPKKMVKNQRYFEGSIWVDDQDLQIVKTYGKGVGITSKNHQFPNFETYRQQIDGKYWFPTYTHADDVLHFPGMSQRIRMVVRYTNYKRFGAQETITYGNTVPDAPSSPAAKK